MAHNTYAHRNGETEAPTERQAFFWFRGDDYGDNQQQNGVVYVMDGPYVVTAFGETMELSKMNGRWWGPVTPPWEDDNGA